MAANFNKVFLMGNLTRDPEMRTLPSGTVVCTFGVAVNRQFVNAAGVTQEEVWETMEPVMAGIFEKFADGKSVTPA
ncbi:MAG TPA: single-stranded DNA-binding protein, partial [Lentisphaeria bacterium]|nr:single-stranded DNA-binding protein [Lentisphaeria bacterium]